MRKTIFVWTLLTAVSLLMIACGAPAANNTGNTANKAANTTAAPAADMAVVETEIKKLANDGVAAILKSDAAALDKLWADNYMFIGQDGAVSTKAQRIDSMKSGASKLESLSYDELSVRSNPEGTGAILIGRATVKGTNMGKPVDGQMRFTQVWAKTKDGWRSVSGQVTPITAAAAKPDDKAPASNTANANAAKPAAPAANK